MILTLDNIRDFIKSDDLLQLSYIGKDEKTGRLMWQLCKPLTIQLSNGKLIEIPEGFETDLSSSPRWAWSIAPPYGDFLFAAVIHDFLYVNRIGIRKDADKEMLTWSNVLNANKLDNKVRYYAVRLFGQSWWNH